MNPRRSNPSGTVHTDELPDTPTRDRNIMASAWVEAPPELLTLGDNLDGQPEAEYKRRIGEWLLWRSGPAVDADAVYLAVHRSDLSRQHRFTLLPDGRGRVVNGGIGVEPEVEQPIRHGRGRAVNGGIGVEPEVEQPIRHGNGVGAGPSGRQHARFREWKADLLGRG